MNKADCKKCNLLKTCEQDVYLCTCGACTLEGDECSDCGQMYCTDCGCDCESHYFHIDYTHIKGEQINMIKQEKWVACRPDGSICGPIDDDQDTLKKILIHGYIQTTDCYGLSETQVWENIQEAGYSIHKATITIKDV